MRKAYRFGSLGEEIGNAITHGVGALFGLVAMIVLIWRTVPTGDPYMIASGAIFGLSAFLMYISSTLYHALQHPGAKYVFRVLDHTSIFVLIAGTYTPFCLVTLRDTVGWYLFAAVWLLAIGGILFEIFLLGKYDVVTVIIYICMGWLVVFAIRPVLAALPTWGVAYLAIGGLLYTSGVVFYAAKRIIWSHFLWHLFVLAGTVSHFLAIMLYVIR